MSSPITHTLVDGVKIVTPGSLELITPYVLLEQQDWFEDEIKFLRRLLQPGDKAIDIGANYGVYALSMARKVGPGGRVWAFEPASATAQRLSEGVAANGFSQVVVSQSALSSASGTAQLSLNQDAETNALVRDKASTAESETVPVVTLDECMGSYGWDDIAFVKIDAEEEEANILKGGRRFFSELSPLVQYEIKAGYDVQPQLMRDFAALGYDAYRLVPGLGLLIPFDSRSTVDGYMLNLFACKPARAEQLARQGFLVNFETQLPTRERPAFKGVAEKLKNGDTYDWRHTIAQLPYGRQLAQLWEPAMAAPSAAELAEALALYALSQDSSPSPIERFLALEASFNLLMALCMRQPSQPHLASLARVARAYGARTVAVDALDLLSTGISQHNAVELAAPFLTPCERFDTVPPGEAVANWFLASVLEEYERLKNFSSYFSKNAARERLQMIRALGFGSEEMQRRLQLLDARFGQSPP